MNCKQCGGLISEDDQYCPHCGASNPYYVEKQHNKEIFEDPFASTSNIKEKPNETSGIDSIRINYNKQTWEDETKTQDKEIEKENKKDKPSFGLALLSFVIPIAGWILYFVLKGDKPKMAKKACRNAWVGFIIFIFIRFVLKLL